MTTELEDGYYLVKSKPKGKLNYMKDKFIVHISGAKKFPEYAVSIYGDELSYDLNEDKIIKFINVDKI